MSADLHVLAAAYALDALEPDERQAFEAHYPSCSTCAAELADYREVAADLAATETQSAPEAIRARVLAEVSQTRQLSPRVVDLRQHRRSRPVMMVGAVAAALVLIVGAAVAAIAAGGSERVTETALVELLASPDVSVRALEGLPSESVTVAWSAQSGSVAVLASGLADPGDDMTYALWLLNSDGATPSLLFDPDDGLVEVVGDLAVSPSGFGVTIEPSGGSPEPTADILFSAEI